MNDLHYLNEGYELLGLQYFHQAKLVPECESLWRMRGNDRSLKNILASMSRIFDNVTMLFMWDFI
jgi:hypothetical protein